MQPTVSEHSIPHAIGLSFAAHGIHPRGDVDPEVMAGYLSGVEQLGGRTIHDDTPYVRKWLGIRISAWRRKRVLDPAIDPAYIEQTLFTPYCPITREKMTVSTGAPTDWSIDRVVNKAGYCPGNLVVMSARANEAKGGHDYRALKEIAANPADYPALKPIEWRRLTTLVGFVEEFARPLPMLVFPPPKLLLNNPYARLQLAISFTPFTDRAKTEPRLRDFLCRLGPEAATALQNFYAVFMPLSHRAPIYLGRDRATRTLWKVADVWENPRVLDVFNEFAALLPPFDPFNPDQVYSPDPMYYQPQDQIRNAWHEASGGYIPGAARFPSPTR